MIPWLVGPYQVVTKVRFGCGHECIGPIGLSVILVQDVKGFRYEILIGHPDEKVAAIAILMAAPKALPQDGQWRGLERRRWRRREVRR